MGSSWLPGCTFCFSTRLLLRSRSQAITLSIRERKPVLVPIRGVDTMDVLTLDIDADQDYWDEEEELERLQEMEEQEAEEEMEEIESSRTVKPREKRGVRWKRRRHQRELGRRARQERREKRKKKVGGGGGNNKNRNHKGGNKKRHKGQKNKGGGKGGSNKKGGGGNKNKNILIPNKHGVKIRSFGEIQLFDLAADPAEKVNLAADPDLADVVALLKDRVIAHFLNLRPRDVPDETELGHPVRWGGYYGPGWCNYTTVSLD